MGEIGKRLFVKIIRDQRGIIMFPKNMVKELKIEKKDFLVPFLVKAKYPDDIFGRRRLIFIFNRNQNRKEFLTEFNEEDLYER